MSQAARPPGKRPSDAADNPSEGSPGPKVKLPRLERGAEDFSNVVKSKLQSYTRTGQACDRCKVRKIRCDALAEGCSHCTNQNLECYVTDRVTGRTERRGYLQQLEREKTAMQNHIRELEKLLQDNGVEVKPWVWPGYGTQPPGTAYDGMGNAPRDPSSRRQWQQIGSLWVRGDPAERKPGIPSGLPSGELTRYSLLESRPTDSYLGVSSADSAPLSSIKGTSLSVLGTTIDIASFDAPDMDEPPPGTPIGSPLYNKSVMAFLQSVLNINPRQGDVDLPSRQDAFTYAEWYFLMLSPFLPILHKPSFLQLLTRIYDDSSYKASTPEMVIVHMMFATIYFQYGIRNREEPEKHAQLNDFSNKHYHWCLSKFFDLAISQTVTAVQALAMIVSHTRNFPKPGCSSTIAHFALMKAIELNFHRKIKFPEGQITSLDYEVRKRSWWAILAVMVTLNGRLGRPMPITLQEFDVDFPIAIPDDLLTEEGVLDPTAIGHCDYNVGVVAYKAVPLFLEMFSNLYAVRRDPRRYVDIVHELEGGMRNIVDTLPEDLQPDKSKPGNQIFALYAQAIVLEFSLCLRHPSVCMTNDARFCAENSRIVEESAKKLLKVVVQLLKVKCLDTTWYQLAVYIAAIFSTLVAHWERRFGTTPEDLAVLRDDMAQWLDVIAEIGRLVGSGTRLANDVSATIERTINWIEHDMHQKAGTPSSQPAIKQQPTSPYQQTLQPQRPASAPHPPLVTSEAPSGELRNVPGPNGSGTYYNATTGISAPYPPPLNYPDPTGGGAAQQNGNGVATAYESAENQYMYSAPPAVSVPTVPSSGPVTEPPAPPNPLIAFASQATQHVAGQAGEDWRPHGQLASQHTGNTWQDWTTAIADSQDRYSANVLVTLGSSRPADVPAGAEHANPGDAAGAANSHTGQWPLLLFHEGSAP